MNTRARRSSRMGRRCKAWVILSVGWLSLIAVNGVGYCDVLLGRVNEWGGVGSAQLLQAIRYNFVLRHLSFPDQIFGAQVFSTADVGRTFTATSGSPGFEGFAARLTNGTDEMLRVQAVIYYIRNGQTLYAGDSLRDYHEYEVQKYVEGHGPDFFGYTISRIDLQINGLSFASPGSNPNGDGRWSESIYDFTYNFYGSVVPEPGTASLLGLGALALLRKGCRPRSAQ